MRRHHNHGLVSIHLINRDLAFPDDVLNDWLMALLSRRENDGVIPFPFEVDIAAFALQKLDEFQIAINGGAVKGGFALLVRAIGVKSFRLCLFKIYQDLTINLLKTLQIKPIFIDIAGPMHSFRYVCKYVRRFSYDVIERILTS